MRKGPREKLKIPVEMLDHWWIQNRPLDFGNREVCQLCDDFTRW